MAKKTAITIGYTASLVGLIVLGAYLTGAHWGHQTVACPTTGLIDCKLVLTGPGSVLVGLPLACWGALWAGLGFLFPRFVRVVWRHYTWIGLGVSGLVWAWTHEILDGHICLWCSAMQLFVIIAIVTSSVVVSRAGRYETTDWRSP
jgi:uncharacterized membrane protein